MSANVEGTKKLVKVSQYKNRHVERFTDLDKLNLFMVVWF